MVTRSRCERLRTNRNALVSWGGRESEKNGKKNGKRLIKTFLGNREAFFESIFSPRTDS